MITLFILLALLVCAFFLVMGLVAGIFRFSFHVTRVLLSMGVTGFILFLLLILILFM